MVEHPPRPLRNEASENDELFLRRAALRTWRYFSEFCTAEHNWMIPDNVRKIRSPLRPASLRPTSGLLFNARQVACDFGYLTVEEFADLTLRTLATMEKLPAIAANCLTGTTPAPCSRFLHPLFPRWTAAT